MSCKTLREELKKREQQVSGNKGELAKRLKKALNDKVPIGWTKDKGKGSVKNKGDGMKGFKEGAFWERLTPDAV